MQGFAIVCVIAMVYELALNCLICQNKGDVIGRLGRRLLFVAFCVLFGAFFVSVQYDEIDYYGPVRVTEEKLYAIRPEQEISQTFPSYYYHYTLKETFEWGKYWGCPASYNGEKWCRHSKDLSHCNSVEITCQGKPPEGRVGECATPKQQDDALLGLLQCRVELMGYGPVGATFDKDVPPWMDGNTSNATTATRTMAVNCDTCTATDSSPPDDLAAEAFVAWSAGGLAMLLALGLLAYDCVVVQRRSNNKDDSITVTTVDGLELNTIA